MADDTTQPDDTTDWRDKIANVLTDPVGSLVNAVPDPFPRLTSAMQGDFSSLTPNTTLQPQPDETSDQYISRMTGPGSTTQFMHDPATNFAMGMLGSIGGVRSLTADLDAYDAARAMQPDAALTSGVFDPKYYSTTQPEFDLTGRFNPVPLTYEKTGWWNTEGRPEDWKYEIKDTGSSVDPQAINELGRLGALHGNSPDAFMRVGDVYNNPNVFKAYPWVPKMWLRDLPQSWSTNLNGAYIPAQKGNPQYMVLNAPRYSFAGPANLQDALEVMHHEVNHAIQNYEDFHQGALPEVYYTPELKNLIAARDPKVSGVPQDAFHPLDARIRKLKGEAYQNYLQTSGENEARNMALRSITPTGHNLYPGWTADYLPHEVIQPWKAPLFPKKPQPSMGSLADPTGYRLLQP